MIKIILIFSFALFVFCFVFFLINEFKFDINKKRNFDLKKLSQNKKRFLISFIIFICASVLSQNIIFALIFCVLYCYFDWHIQDKNKRKRLALVDQQVMEALNIIKSSVMSGQSLQNAFIVAKNELKYPIKNEFIRISDKLAFGMNFDKVLEETSKNIVSKEFKFMIDIIRVSKDTGGSLGSIFDRILDTVVQRTNIQSQITALTAQGRMSGNIVSIIPFVVIFIMYTIEPEIIESLFVTLIGNILLLIVVVMVLSGSFIIRKMTEIEL
ncbi:MAG: type II secretion system F family protein [Endomicrobium sp.]|jgi:tight adherence protein B|nr:type II secretion system F family protein [Endomicrobium sp.]